MESLDLTARFVLAFLWLLHHGLPGLLFITAHAFVEHRIQLAGVDLGTPYFTGKHMQLTISWMFIFAGLLGFVLGRFGSADVYPYIYASVAVIVSCDRPMTWLMRRFTRPRAVV